MDFSRILSLANSNKDRALQQAQERQNAAKRAKMAASSTVTSDAVQKFLQRKDAEKRRKEASEAERKEALLSLRAAAKHNRKASAMANRTKDNNFGVRVAGATETVQDERSKHEKPTVGVSKSNSVGGKQALGNAITSRQMNTKKDNRVRDGLDSKNVNNSSMKGVQNGTSKVSNKAQGKINFPAKKNVGNSAIDFNSLMKLAKTKQFEPVRIPVREEEPSEPRLMTQSEKERYLEEQARKLGLSVSFDRKTSEKKSSAAPTKASSKSASEAASSNKISLPRTNVNAQNSVKNGPPEIAKKKLGAVSSLSQKQKPGPVNSCRREFERAKEMRPQQQQPQQQQQQQQPQPQPSPSQSPFRQSLPARRPDDRLMANDRLKPKVPLSKKLDPVTRRELLPPNRMRDFQRRPLPPMKRRIINDDEDEELDDEMADFIDDTIPIDEDYSKHIREIFGYDKRQYLELDQDDCMESSFTRQMQEEAYSTRAGYLEDLEDIRREQDELERKYKMNKKKKRAS